jgi:hypothetical protein
LLTYSCLPYLNYSNTYFKDIGYNKDLSFDWSGNEWRNAVHSKYDEEIVEKIKSGEELKSLSQLEQESGKVFVLFIDIKIGLQTQPFKKIGEYFSIWHEIERGNYDGLHQFGWKNENYIIIVNKAEASSMFKSLKKTKKIWMPEEFAAS